MKLTTSAALALLLLAQSVTAKPLTGEALQQKALLIPTGAPVLVRTTGKQKIKGTLTGLTAEGLSLKTEEGASRTLPLSEVASLKQKGKPPKPTPPAAKTPSVPNAPSPVMVKKSLSAIPVGSPIKVRMPGGQLVDGKLTGTTPDGFQFQTIESGSLVTKSLAFNQVAGIKGPSLGLRKSIPGLKPPALQTPAALKAKAIKIPTGSPITVQMPDGAQVSGKLMETTNDGMKIQSLQNGDLVTHTVGFDQMGSFKPGLPVTMSARAKTAVKSVVVIAVTAAATGFIAGKIGKN